MLEDDQIPKIKHAGKEDSINESGSRPFSSFSTREQQSPSQTENVRTKVSSWLSGLVEEVRRKSSNPIQKWTDSGPNLSNRIKDQNVSNLYTVETEKQNEQQSKSQFDKECDNILQEGSKETEEQRCKDTLTESTNEKVSPSVEICEALTNKEIEGTNFWAKEGIFNRFGGKTLNTSSTVGVERQKQELSSETANKITVSQITSIGRSKINEFYDKVRQNKARYYSLVKKDSIMSTNKSAEEQQASVSTTNSVKDLEKTECDVDLKLNTINNEGEYAEEDEDEYESNFGNFDDINKEDAVKSANIIESKINKSTTSTSEPIPHLLSPVWRDEILDPSDASDEYPTFSGRLKLSQIGRSQTSNPAYNRVSSPLSEISLSSTSSILNEQELKNEKRHLLSPPKNINLANIGRSFSERKDDEDEENDDFLLNERSHSCSHVIPHQPKSQPYSISPTATTQPFYINNNENAINNNNNCNHHSRNNNPKRNVSSSLPSFLENANNRSISVLSGNRGKLTRQSTAATTSSTIYRESSLSLSDSPRRSILLRDSSFQSDSSHCSSVESLLEARKPDPEAILINLGFGPVESEDVLSRIPKRFLKNSQVHGIDTEAFLRRQQLANHLHDHSVLGYRGLVGNPDIPPSKIVAKIMERFELNERTRCVMDINMNRPQSAPPTPGPDQ